MGLARRAAAVALIVPVAVFIMAVTLVVPGCDGGEEPAGASVIAKEKQLRERIALNPADLNARLVLGNLYYDTDRPHRAIEHYMEVLKHRPDDANVRTDLGTCFKRVNRLDRAREQYEIVLKDHPTKLQTIYNLAVVSELLGDWKRAARLWDRVVALKPNSKQGRAAVDFAAKARQEAAKKQAAAEKKARERLKGQPSGSDPKAEPKKD